MLVRGSTFMLRFVVKYLMTGFRDLFLAVVLLKLRKTTFHVINVFFLIGGQFRRRDLFECFLALGSQH